MFLLKLLGTGVIIMVGLYLVAFLEEAFFSGPRRRELQRRARLINSGGAGSETPGEP